MTDKVTINTAGLTRARSILEKAMSAPGVDASNPISKMFVQWGARYAAAMRRRFITQSRSGGGGEWPPLAESTKAARRGPNDRARRRKNVITRFRKAGKPLTGTALKSEMLKAAARERERKKTRAAKTPAKKPAERKFAILVDTGQLRDALEPQAPGNLLESIPGGIRVGFAATPRSGDGITMGDLASWHHYGQGNLPVRRLLVEPDEQTRAGMVSDAQRAADEIGRMVGGGK